MWGAAIDDIAGSRFEGSRGSIPNVSGVQPVLVRAKGNYRSDELQCRSLDAWDALFFRLEGATAVETLWETATCYHLAKWTDSLELEITEGKSPALCSSPEQRSQDEGHCKLTRDILRTLTGEVIHPPPGRIGFSRAGQPAARHCPRLILVVVTNALGRHFDGCPMQKPIEHPSTSSRLVELNRGSGAKSRGRMQSISRPRLSKGEGGGYLGAPCRRVLPGCIAARRDHRGRSCGSPRRFQRGWRLPEHGGGQSSEAAGAEGLQLEPHASPHFFLYMTPKIPL